MRSRWVVLIIAVVAILVVTNVLTLVAYLNALETPVLKSRNVNLTLDSSSNWTSKFCIPVGTMFEFFWSTSDRSFANLTIMSQDLLMPLQYQEYAPGGNGLRSSAGQEMFEAFNVSHPSTEVFVTLAYDYNTTLGSSVPPPGNPC